MISVEIYINNRVIQTVHAINRGHAGTNWPGKHQYEVFDELPIRVDGKMSVKPIAFVYHRRKDGANVLARKMLEAHHAYKESNRCPSPPTPVTSETLTSIAKGLNTPSGP
jgi:hypothetical protein